MAKKDSKIMPTVNIFKQFPLFRSYKDLQSYVEVKLKIIEHSTSSTSLNSTESVPKITLNSSLGNIENDETIDTSAPIRAVSKNN